MGLVSFNIFINDLAGGIECNLSRFADDTEVGGVADTAEGHAAIQRCGHFTVLCDQALA